MNLFKGLGKAGTDILGGVTKGAGKLVETAGDVAGATPIVGGVVGGVVGGTGKAIETVGQATEDLGENLFGEKEDEKKADEALVDQEEEDYIPPYEQVFVWLDGEEDGDYYDDTLEDLMAYDAAQARLREEAADGEGEKMDEE